jgi:hypothetical protein
MNKISKVDIECARAADGFRELGNDSLLQESSAGIESLRLDVSAFKQHKVKDEIQEWRAGVLQRVER